MHALARRLADRALKTGNITLIDADGVAQKFGDGTGPALVIEITDRKTETGIAFDPNLKFGEAYMDGRLILRQGDLSDLLDTVFSNVANMGEASHLSRLVDTARFLGRRLHQWNTLTRSRANVAHHYDISNDLYRAFLDQDMQYSCAYFTKPHIGLEAAQAAKRRHIAAKLLLEDHHKLLDIGSGWGGLGLYLAEMTGADVTGVTLSTEQVSLARERTEARGLVDRVRFLEKDYRHLEGPVDRIVSVGMFEHVGINNYRTFFDKCAALLKEDGVMLLHSIGRSDGPGATNAFINKYIFPGGYIPALSEVLPAIEQSGLIVTDIEILRLHYAETLKHWRERFRGVADALDAAYDERFQRMWEFYLATSELAFRRLGMMVFHIQLARRQDAVPLTRDYIARAEADLLAREKGHSPFCVGSSARRTG